MVGYPGPIKNELIDMRKMCLLVVVSTMIYLGSGTLSVAGQVKVESNVNSGDTLVEPMLNQVLIVVTMPHANVPMAQTSVNAKKIAPLHNGQDLPYLLRFTPSLVVTSDAGNGVGYTGMWLRGSDPSRINVSINDIPLNDPESQQVFWVNTPDLGSSATNIQVQRGVGTSTSGAGAFGGSVRIDTRNYSYEPYTQFSSSYGSFATMRNTLSFGTGKLKERFTLNGRLSQISSQGYLDRASTKLYSAYADAEWSRHRTAWRMIAFSGRERTYQSWYGTPWEVLYGSQEQKQAFVDRNGLTSQQAENLLNSGRTYNFYQYQDQVDVYGQDHAQLSFRKNFSNDLSFNASMNYTKGAGYFEEKKENEDLSRYGLEPVLTQNDTLLSSDVIRRRWLKNHFVGGVFSLLYRRPKTDFTWGGNVHQYLGEHFGELIWMQYAGAIDKNHRYYQGWSNKLDAGSYLKVNHKVGKKLDIYLDGQLRYVNYSTNGNDNDLLGYKIDSEFIFFNPKVGATYTHTPYLKLFGSVARGNKEPNRNDFVDATNLSLVRSESMVDYETGIVWKKKSMEVSGNVYFMDYTNQLVLNGTLNDVGAPLRTNVKDSYRAGVELMAEYQRQWNYNQALSISGNFTLSRNRISQFDNIIYDYTGEQVLIIAEKMKDVPISFSPGIISGVQIRYDRYTLFTKRNSYTNLTPIEMAERTRAPFSAMLMWKMVGKQYMDNTGNEALAINAYQVVDARLSYEFVSNSHEGTLECSIGVNNILGSRYVSNGYTYSYIYESRVTERFYYPQALRQWTIGFKLTL
jgi:iron complex outermembrane recepter protein